MNCRFHAIMFYLFLFVISGGTVAAHPPSDPTDEVAGIVLKGATVTYTGTLNDQNIDRFMETVGDKKVSRLIIGSGGGEITAGMRLGDWVFDNRVDVVVERMCMSSCANYVFTAGRLKTISEGAIVAWHGNILQKTGMSDEDLTTTVVEAYHQLPDNLKKEYDLETLINQSIVQMREYRVASVAAEERFFGKIGVDEFICRVGNEIYGAENFFILSADDMAQFGVLNVQVPENYEQTDLRPFLRKGKQIEFVQLKKAPDEMPVID